MKVALITDTHWGIRNDNIAFIDNTKRFLDDIFFPTLLRDGISDVWHLGDLVDRRKYINFLTAKRLREDFLEPLYKNNISMKIIAGNHDVFYKNTNGVNALDEMLAGKYGVEIYKNPTEINFHGTKVLFLPWINDENREESLNAIKTTQAKTVLGHLELQGFEMFRGSINSHGDDPSIFGRFDRVFSGHYHHRSTNGNISYLGSHAEFTWSDYDDPRGFHIFDTDTGSLEFIQNPYNMFTKIWYDDSKDFKPTVDIDKIKGRIVKVIVKNKTNPYLFDVLISKIEAAQPLNLQIVEDNLNLDLETDDNIVNEAESTIDIFKKYIDQINSAGVNKARLETTIVNLYNEALNIA